MTLKLTEEDLEARKVEIILAARWCFLNFGFAKTSIDDIAKRADLSPTLVYKPIKNKEEIFKSVFRHWLMAHLPEAGAAADSSGNTFDRLLTVSRVVAVDPWSVMYGAPMSGEFFEACGRIDEEISATHRRIATECVERILNDRTSADVFILALDGLLADHPSPDVLTSRVEVLCLRFS